MITKSLIGRCGLYCGACSIYRAYKDSRKLQETLARKHKCSVEEVRCEGCQVVLKKGWSGEENWGRNCKIIQCLDAKKLKFCYECNDYEKCERFNELLDAYLQYGENLRDNLNKIKTGKAEEWLEEQDKKWRCLSCNKPVSMYLTECHWCGAKLSEKRA